MIESAMGIVRSYSPELLLIAADSVANSLVDQAAPWKEERYSFYARKLASELQESCPQVSAISQLLINDIPTSARERYHSFHREMRLALRSSSDDATTAALQEACVRWFTKINIADNLEDIVFALARAGQETRQNEPSLDQKLEGKSLLDKVKVMFEALEHTPANQLAPSVQLTLAKTLKGTSWWDPFAFTNMPWQYCSQIYQHGEEEKKVINIRIGVPTGPASGSDSEISLFNMALVPEYIAFVEGLEEQGKKLTCFLHLNPTHLGVDIADDRLIYAPQLSYNPMYYLIDNEAIWTKLFIELNARHPDTIEICLLPFDGKWKDEFFDDRPTTPAALGAQLLDEVIMAPISPFIFSNKLLYRGDELKELADLQQLGTTRTAEQEERYKLLTGLPAAYHRQKLTGDMEALQSQPLYLFIQELLKDVCEGYFSYEKDAMLTQSQKYAFYGIFLTHLQEKIQETLGSDIVQNNCVDGIDRTAEIMGSKIAINLMRDGLYDDPEAHKAFIAQVLTPALAIWKRPVLTGRRKVFMGVLSHIEQMLSDGRPIPRPANWRRIVL